MIKESIFIFTSWLLFNSQVVSQRQLLVTSGNKVLHRFKEGESFSIKRLDKRTAHHVLILKINEFEVITSQDTIPIQEIRKVVVKGKPLIKRIGITLIKIGAMYFLADQFNSAVIQHNPSINEPILKLSAVLVGTGLPLLLFKRDWKKIGRNYRLTSIGQDSNLYRVE